MMKNSFRLSNHLVFCVICLLTPWLCVSCEPNINPPPPPEEVTIFLPEFFLGDCDDFFEGLRPLGIIAFVDGIDANGEATNLYEARPSGLNNNDNSGYEFEIDIPSSGNFMVSVLVTGNCYKCCNSTGCALFDDGDPMFLASTVIYNATTVPLQLNMFPEFVECKDCGC